MITLETHQHLILFNSQLISKLTFILYKLHNFDFKWRIKQMIILSPLMLINLIFFQFIIQVIYYIMVITLSDNKFNLKKMLLFSVLLSLSGTFGIISLTNIIPNLRGHNQLLFSSYICIFMNVFGIYFFVEKNFRKAFLFSGIISFIQDNLLLLSTIIIPFLPMKIFEEIHVGDSVLYAIIGVFMVLFLKKTNFKFFIKHILGNQKQTLVSLVVCFILPVILNWEMRITDFKGASVNNGMMVYLFISLMFILLLAIFQHIATVQIDNEKIKTQKAILKQQQIYVQSLEKIQQQMRTFRHDYKNILSGLYIQAKEGEVEAVQEFLQKMMVNFDTQVGENIKQTTQLSNIHIIELKSLLLTKLMEMHQKGITCNLEVLYPIETLPMEVEDINRCLGILIDNAIEEVESQINPSIDIIISNQIKCVTILVKNKVENNIQFHEIWNLGYSTKGENRGIGLYSYQEIIEKYTNVIPLTDWSNHYFTQELKIVGE